MTLSLPAMLLAVAIVTLGTAVQASLGFGLALVAAPLLYLLDPAFIPGPMVATAFVLSIWVAWGDRDAIDFQHFGPALAGRLIGSPLAALLLGVVSTQTFDVLFGVLVLLAVGMSLIHPHVVPRPGTVFAATLASGLMGTLSGIGGPPIALVYQNSRGPALRANLAVLFLIGTAISLVSLAVIGRFGVRELQYSALLLAGVAPGYVCAGYLKCHLDRRSARPFLLVLCVLSALMVLSRSALVLWRA